MVRATILSQIPEYAGHRFRRYPKSGRHAAGTGGRHGPERVADIRRNHGPAWPGLRTQGQSGGKQKTCHPWQVSSGRGRLSFALKWGTVPFCGGDWACLPWPAGRGTNDTGLMRCRRAHRLFPAWKLPQATLSLGQSDFESLGLFCRVNGLNVLQTSLYLDLLNCQSPGPVYLWQPVRRAGRRRAV